MASEDAADLPSAGSKVKKNKLGRTELHIAVFAEDDELVEQLLRSRADVDATDNSRQTALHVAAQSEGETQILQMLLEARASTDVKDARGFTPLEVANFFQCPEAVKVLQTASYTSQQVEEALEEQEEDSTLDVLHFLPKHMPAVLDAMNEITYEGRILPEAQQCWVSFPGKFKSGWDSLIAKNLNASVACVFLCDAEAGLGKHAEDPDGGGACYCKRIYGNRQTPRGIAWYEKFGYMIQVSKKKQDCTSEEMAKLEQKREAMNAVLIFKDDNEEEKRKEAKEKWIAANKTAAWGCQWYAVWYQRVKDAVERGQRLKVVFFPDQVNQGIEPMDKLATADLWNGIGLGTSQKCEVAMLEAMQNVDPRWQYDAVDVMDFLKEQFTPGDIVEALDQKTQRWRVGRIVEISRRDTEKERRLTWNVQCNWSKKKLWSDHVRPVEHTDAFQELFMALKDEKVQQSLKEALNLQMPSLTVHEARSGGKASIAVNVTLQSIQEAHAIRDKVLSGDLDMVMLNAASTSWEVGIDKSAFLEFYEFQLRGLTDLTDHQTQKFEELTSADNDTLHLSAAAGSGKTFLAAKYVKDQLWTSSRAILFIAPNKALVFYFVHWLVSFVQAKLKTQVKDEINEVKKIFKRFRVTFEPYRELLEPTIKESQIGLVPAESEDVYLLKVVDEAHQIFSSASDPDIQQRVKSFQATRTLLLSDASQASTLATSFQEHFPNRHEVELSEVVRCTQRIVAGAASFQIGTDSSATTSLGTAGPPLKTYLFELKEEQNAMKEYVQQTVKALYYVIDMYPRINLQNRIACLVKDEKFLEEFRNLFQEQLEQDFAKRFSVVSCEGFLRSIPALQSGQKRGAFAPVLQENIVVDTVSNARGLEQLVVMSIGLDAPISRTDVDGLTRCNLYQSITRAQLVSIIINHFIPDGWLAFLGALKLEKVIFDQGKAHAEILRDAAFELLQDQQEDIEDVSGEDETAEEASMEETSQDTAGEVRTTTTTVWDTSDNSITMISKLEFDPRVGLEAKEKREEMKRTLSSFWSRRIETEDIKPWYWGRLAQLGGGTVHGVFYDPEACKRKFRELEGLD